MCASLMFLFICITLKSVPALKLILSLCIAEEGQTERQREKVKVVSSKGCGGIITSEGKDRENEINKRKEESRGT